MRYLRAALARLAGVFTGHRADDDLRDELQSHLEMETAENIRRGMPPDEARRQALLASGGLTQAAEAVRDQRGLPWIENLVADIRYALRTLRHSPAFTGSRRDHPGARHRCQHGDLQRCPRRAAQAAAPS